MFLSNRTKSKTHARRKAPRKSTASRRTPAPRGRRGAPRSRSAQKQWNRKGQQRGARLSRLSSFLPILERREDKQHVVSFDPDEHDIEGVPRRRAARRSSRGRQTPQARGRRSVREGDEDLEEVRSTSRRRAMRGAPMQEEADKIQIEVGSVKALSTKYGIVRGMTWMVILSLVLWWIPLLGPATVGYVGGRKAGGPFRAAVAALVPLLFVFGAVAVTSNSVENAPLAVKHYISSGYQAVLGSLPFDFPLLSYIFSNLAAVMTAGPDALFSVLAFALVGGAVTQMRVHENSVPPITARLPKHRLVQGPARSYENANEALETLVARLAAVVERAERRGSLPGGQGASGHAPSGRRGWGTSVFGRGHADVPERYPELKSTVAPAAAASAPAAMDSPARQVVSSVLASTAPMAKGRAAKQAVRAARPVELEIPSAIALADGDGTDASVSTLASAHLYRPSKMYHIYGGSVNPVARKKLEKRLRRTHTVHTMRRSARALVKQPDARPRSERLLEVDELVEEDASKPRSLERTAIASSLHYDALEHLENATVAPPAPRAPKHPKPKKEATTPGYEEDELGGLIAHIGEGGEAVVDTTAVRDLDFTDGPVFDRRGRQRARISGNARQEPVAEAAKSPEGSPAGTSGAQERRQDAAHDKARLDRWLKRTMADMPEAPAGKLSPRAEPTKAPVAHPAAEPPGQDPPRDGESRGEQPRKPRERGHPGPAAHFEVTHGSVEADGEVETDDGESAASSGGKRNRTAAQILKEIRQQKKDDAAAKEQAEVAKRARDAKAAADEIERRIRHNEDASVVNSDGEVRPEQSTGPANPTSSGEAAVVGAGGQATALQAHPKARRHRSDDLEAVLTTNEELSGDLELTLDPIREDDASARKAHAAVAQIAMLDPDEGEAPGAPNRAGMAAPRTGAPQAGAPDGEPPAAPEGGAPDGPSSAGAHGPAAEGRVGEGPEADRAAGLEDVVLAGPSTDTPGGDPEEAELSDNDREKIRKRLQEGWNRL